MWNHFLLNTTWTAGFLRWKISLFPASLLAVLRPQFITHSASLRLVPNACLSCIQAGFESSDQNATSRSIVQCSNLHEHQHVGSCDIKHDSRSGGCEFYLPNRLFLCPWSHFTHQTYSCTLWTAACVISLATAPLYPWSLPYNAEC